MNQLARQSIEELEAAMLQEPQVEIETKHYFADGLYAREIFIPKGTLLTGKIHKREHINIISKGDITVVTTNGKKRVKAPCTIISEPGTKRAGFAHEDTIWITVHAVESNDIEEIEAMLVTTNYDEYLLATAPYGLIEE